MARKKWRVQKKRGGLNQAYANRLITQRVNTHYARMREHFKVLFELFPKPSRKTRREEDVGENHKEGCVVAFVGFAILAISLLGVVEAWEIALPMAYMGMLVGLFGAFRLIEGMPRWHAFCWSVAGVVCIRFASFIA